MKRKEIKRRLDDRAEANNVVKTTGLTSAIETSSAKALMIFNLVGDIESYIGASAIDENVQESPNNSKILNVLQDTVSTQVATLERLQNIYEFLKN